MVDRLNGQLRVVPERHSGQDGVDRVQAAGDLSPVDVNLLQQGAQALVEVGVDLFQPVPPGAGQVIGDQLLVDLLQGCQ